MGLFGKQFQGKPDLDSDINQDDGVSNKDIKIKLLDDLVEKIMGLEDESPQEESEESADEESREDSSGLGELLDQADPKAKVSMLELEAKKPKGF